MDAFAKMDIFFLVTTAAVVVFVVFVGALLYYVIRTARDVSEVVRTVKKESERFVRGTSAARWQMVQGGGGMVQKVIAFVQSFASARKKKSEK
ncbi:MAG: hypothetical protein AAB497_02375 [Patescibacteria group bacterium]